MAVKTRAIIKAELLATLINTAPEGTITPEIIKGFFDDVVDSSLVKPTDTNMQGFYGYSATRTYYTGEYTIYDYKWYKANTDPVVGAFSSSDWDFQSYVIYSATEVIETAQVLTLNSVPVSLQPAIASKSYAVVSGFLSINYNSVPYATNMTVQLITDTAVVDQLQFLSALNASVSRHTQGRLTTAAVAATDTQLIANKALMAQVLTGDPTAGNSQITINYSYIVI